jgi:hypothetical protein
LEKSMACAWLPTLMKFLTVISLIVSKLFPLPFPVSSQPFFLCHGF